jgi:hypothetical protein
MTEHTSLFHILIEFMYSRGSLQTTPLRYEVGIVRDGFYLGRLLVLVKSRLVDLNWVGAIFQ